MLHVKTIQMFYSYSAAGIECNANHAMQWKGVILMHHCRYYEILTK